MFQEYRGDYGMTKEELVAWHKHRFAYFTNYAPADFLICETIRASWRWRPLWTC